MTHKPFDGWLNAARAAQPETIRLRRRIHETPEMGLHLPETVMAVKESLAGLDVTIAEGPSTCGMVVTLAGLEQGRTILLRGDMDALPMPEDTGLPFQSKVQGVMHACGHDSHTAMLTSAVRVLHDRRDRLAGTVKFMFQPGEEGHDGARKMMADGLLGTSRLPDAAFALHITPNLPTGVISTRPGAFFAAADGVYITVWGKGGHASAPHRALDPVPVVCEILLTLQNVVTRRLDPFDPVILTLPVVKAGTAGNVIPEKASLMGSLRSVSEISRKAARETIDMVAKNLAKAHGAWAEVKIYPGACVTDNDPRMAALTASAVRGALGEDLFLPMQAPAMASEDWAFVLEKIPGAMAFLGVAPEGCDHLTAAPYHSNKMLIEESAMANGVATLAAVAETFLAKGFGS